MGAEDAMRARILTASVAEAEKQETLKRLVHIKNQTLRSRDSVRKRGFDTTEDSTRGRTGGGQEGIAGRRGRLLGEALDTWNAREARDMQAYWETWRCPSHFCAD